MFQDLSTFQTGILSISSETYTLRNIKLGCLKNWKSEKGKVGKVKKNLPIFVLKQQINFNKSTLTFLKNKLKNEH